MQRATRRGYLVAAAGIAGLSGCQDALDGGDSGGRSDDDSDETPESEPDGPRHTVETFYRALNQGEFEAARKLLHSETLERPVTQDRYGQLAENDLTVESVETIEDGENKAIVRANLKFVTTATSEPITDTIEIELRTEGGEWRIYASGSRVEYEDTPTAEPDPDEPTPDSDPVVTGDPATVVEEFYAALNAGNRKAANARLHSEAQGIDVTQQAADAMEDASLTVENVALVAERSDSATVEVTVTISPAGTEREQSNRVRIELRPERGQWRIYSATQAN